MSKVVEPSLGKLFADKYGEVRKYTKFQYFFLGFYFAWLDVTGKIRLFRPPGLAG